MNTFPVRGLLRKLIRSGTLNIVNPRGDTETFGSGAPSVTIEIVDETVFWKWFLAPDLHVGETYMDGSFKVLDGDIYDFLKLCCANLGWRYDESWLWAARAVLRRWRRRFGRKMMNTISDARRNSESHYDLADDFFDLFLDSDRQYSCAYFATAEDTLERAQERKKDHLAAKLLLRPGQRVLDIGCGWGGLALHLARVADVEVTGVTLSKEQCAYARRRAREMGLDNRVQFYVEDYRLASGSFDRVVSVGMFEHVGIAHYRSYFEKVSELLNEDGVGLVHTIGGAAGPDGGNPWIDKYIFPGGDVPALSDIVPFVERIGLFITDIEVLRLHYAETLRAWRMRFLANRARAAQLYDERFCLMWEFYLASCEAGFRHLGLVNFQIQLTKKVDAAPVTRDYIYEWEARRHNETLTCETRRAS